MGNDPVQLQVLPLEDCMVIVVVLGGSYIVIVMVVVGRLVVVVRLVVLVLTSPLPGTCSGCGPWSSTTAGAATAGTALLDGLTDLYVVVMLGGFFGFFVRVLL